MSVKQCLTSGDHAKIKNAVDKNKPMSMAKQKMAEKQEKMFYDLNKDSGFQKEISGLKRMDKITAIQKKYAQNGVQITRQQVNKMMKNGVTIIKPLPIAMPKAVAKPIVIPRVPPKVVSIPKEIVPEIKPIVKPPLVGAFQEAKTIDEALEKWREFGRFRPDGLSSFEKSKQLKMMNQLNAQMDSMKGWIQGRKISSISFADGDAQWDGTSMVRKKMRENRLQMSTRAAWTDPSKREKSFGSLKSGRWTVSGSNASVVLRHEMGHAMWYDATFSNSKFKGDFTRKFLSMNKTIIKRHVSEYATTNASEFFAETFSIYSSPQFISGSLNKVFGSGFEGLIENALLAGVK